MCNVVNAHVGEKEDDEEKDEESNYLGTLKANYTDDVTDYVSKQFEVEDEQLTDKLIALVNDVYNDDLDLKKHCQVIFYYHQSSTRARGVPNKAKK